MNMLVIASTNKGKIEEFKKLLYDFPLEVIPQPSNLEVDEIGKNFFENARLKAIAAARVTGKISLADDSGLCVRSLDGAPGIHSSRYAKTDQERVFKLLNELKNFHDRTAYFAAAFCLASPNGEILFEVEGRCDGEIAKVPRGSYGFGYDPIFEVKGTGLTFSEMDSDQKKEFSHRGRAFRKLMPALKGIYSF